MVNNYIYQDDDSIDKDTNSIDKDDESLETNSKNTLEQLEKEKEVKDDDSVISDLSDETDSD